MRARHVSCAQQFSFREWEGPEDSCLGSRGIGATSMSFKNVKPGGRPWFELRCMRSGAIGLQWWGFLKSCRIASYTTIA